MDISYKDMLSALPDHILLSILERVDFSTAVKAGILSRRWTSLPWRCSELMIGMHNFYPAPLPDLKVNDLPPAMAALAKTTKQFLAAPARERTINSLGLWFYLMEEEYMSDISRLLSEAVDSGKLTGFLYLLMTAHGSEPKTSQVYAQRLMCFMRVSPNVFGRLNMLSLVDVHSHAPGDINSLLRSCKLLKTLHLFECNFGESTVVKIDAPESQLCELKLDECIYEKVELLHVPRLARINCDRWISSGPPLSFGSTPCIQHLRMSHEVISDWFIKFKLSELLAKTASIQHLMLEFSSSKIWVQLEDPRRLTTAFGKLKTLKLSGIYYECDLSWVVLLVSAAPVLEKLRIDVYKYDNPEMPEELKETLLSPLPVDLLQKAYDFKHYYLKELKISGFTAEDNQTKFVRLILRQAVRLKHVVLTDQDPCNICHTVDIKRVSVNIIWTGDQDPHVNSNAPLEECSFPEITDQKDLIIKQLKEGISTSAEIMIRYVETCQLKFSVFHSNRV